MSAKVIYLDDAATTPLAPEVIEVMQKALSGDFWANVSSPHYFGKKAHNAVEQAINSIASSLCCSSNELIITSGATESTNQAIKGVMWAQKQKKHLITSTTEHKATLQTVQSLLKQGYKATFIAPNHEGQITPEMILTAITEDTALVSLIWVNNETGLQFDIPTIGKMLKDKNILFHVDATQAIPRFKVNLSLNYIDLLSMSAHKCYGPKGVGLLYRRSFPKVEMKPLIDGGAAQKGLRAGTLPNHQILGLAKSLELLNIHYVNQLKQQSEFSQFILNKLMLFGVTRNEGSISVPSIMNLHIPDVFAETLIDTVPNVCFSAGSACSTAQVAPSHVLTELGYSSLHARQSIRLSFGRYLRKDELVYALDALSIGIQSLQNIARGIRSDFALPCPYDLGVYIPDLVEAKAFNANQEIIIDDESFQFKLILRKESILISNVNVQVLGTSFLIYAIHKLVSYMRGCRIAELSSFKFTSEFLGCQIPENEIRILVKLEKLIKHIAK